MNHTVSTTTVSAATISAPADSSGAHAGPADRPLHPRWWRRAVGVGLVTTLLSFGTVSAGAVTTAVAPASRAVLVDWTSGSTDDPWSYGGGQSWGDGQSSGGQSSGGQSGNSYSQSGSTTTVDSQPATAAETRGVALIDTVLGYQDAAAAGTGIVLTSNGEVLTNYHVVEGATSIKVTIASTGKTYTAAVVGHDQTDDIALLKLTDASGLTTATIDDDTVATGDHVSAVGNAGGTDSLTAADGTVTSLSETITTESESGVAGETLENLIATDADVVPGDSGGPLNDHEGEVIGVDTAASTGSEINGYAIPIDTALRIVQEIRSGDETSTVQIGAGAFLGVQVSSADAADSSSDGSSSGDSYPGDLYGDGYAQDSATQQSAGALVAGVEDGSPADTAGLQAGDTITAIGGSTVSSADDVSTLVQKHDAGDRVKVSWTDSSGDQHSATVKLAASPVA
jgi:S1-C subfamily serine protease